MKKIYKIKDLDCAHCAAKIEHMINELDSVNKCSLNFIQQKLVVDINDTQVESTLKQIQSIVHRVEPDCKLL